MSEKLIEDVNQIVNSQLKEGDVINFNDFKKKKEAAKPKGTPSLWEVSAMADENNWKKVWFYIESNSSSDNVSMIDSYHFDISLDELKKSWKTARQGKQLLKKIKREESRVTHIFVSPVNGRPVDGANIKTL